MPPRPCCAFRGSSWLGGHSKGGNLAVYAAAFCPAALQERIAAVYNNDGPGFDADVIALPGYQRICARVQTFVPQSSIVGMLLEHEEAYTIIHSTGDGFGQHNLYTWEVLRDRFVTLETVTNGSRFLDRTLKQWLAGLEPGASASGRSTRSTTCCAKRTPRRCMN